MLGKRVPFEFKFVGSSPLARKAYEEVREKKCPLAQPNFKVIIDLRVRPWLRICKDALRASSDQAKLLWKKRILKTEQQL